MLLTTRAVPEAQSRSRLASDAHVGPASAAGGTDSPDAEVDRASRDNSVRHLIIDDFHRGTVVRALN
jgi:hypothetical protein